jgi:hypothetical protein
VKPFGANKILGLSVGERGVLCCELARGAGGPRAERMAEFAFPPGLSVDDPGPLGKALGQFLKEQKFSARRAVVGVPLRWAVIKPKDVPPVDPAALDDVLRLQAERDFSLESHDLVYEYAGESSTAASRTVLMMAVQRKRVDGVVALAKAAGLSVEAVTLSSVALAEETSRLTGGEGAVLHVTSSSAELAVQHAGHPRVLRHLRVPAGVSASAGTASGGAPGPEGNGPPEHGPLGLELRQVLSLMPQNGTAPELVLWDGVGLGDTPRRWGEALGRTIKEQSLTDLGVTGGVEGGGPAGRYAAAVALALAPLRGEAVRPNLLRSRLAPRKQRRVGRPMAWGIAIGATVALLIAVAVWDLSDLRSQAADLRQQLRDQQEDVKDAQATIARTAFALAWTDTQPRFLECLYDLTTAFPRDGRVWAVDLKLTADGKGTSTCRAADRTTALGLLDQLRQTGRFTDVTLINLQAVDRSSDWTVSFGFKYAGVAPPAVVPATVAPAGAATRSANPAQPASRPGGR